MKSRRTTLIIFVATVFSITICVLAIHIFKLPHESQFRKGSCQVDFWIENSLHDTQFVNPGESVYPKPVEFNPNRVFTGWDVDLNNIQENVTAKAMFESTDDKTNCLALESVYCTAGESVTMGLVLCGTVDIASADFTIRYDPSILRLGGVKDIDPSIVTNYDEEKGIIYCSMLLDQEVEGDIDCMQLQFSAIGGEGSTGVIIEVDDASKIKNDKIVDAISEPISGTVFILKAR